MRALLAAGGLLLLCGCAERQQAVQAREQYYQSVADYRACIQAASSPQQCERERALALLDAAQWYERRDAWDAKMARIGRAGAALHQWGLEQQAIQSGTPLVLVEPQP